MMGPLAASASSGAVGAAAGLLGGSTASVGANSGDGEVGLLLTVLGVLGGCSEDGQRLLMAVDGGCAPVGLVGQGTDVLVVILGELEADGSREAV